MAVEKDPTLGQQAAKGSQYFFSEMSSCRGLGAALETLFVHVTDVYGLYYFKIYFEK